MKSMLIKCSMFLAIFTLFTLSVAQVEPTAAQIIIGDDPPVFLTDLECKLIVSTDEAGRNRVASGYSGYVDGLWFRFEVKNRGPIPIAQLVDFSRDIILNGGSVDPYAPSIFVPKLLAAGQTYKYAPIYVNLGAPLTSLHAYMDVDPQDNIPETHQWNNRCEFDYSYFGLFP